MLNKKIDFSKPLQVYRWLRYLDNNSKYGYLIKPNLLLKKRNLGFSFKSNKIGLRGEIPEKSDIVIIGTSYAMGFGVDNGDNWYELSNKTRNGFNIGLPVGFKEWINLKNDFASEINKTALVIYHCNFLTHEEIYKKWRDTSLSVEEAFNWQKRFFSALKLQYSKKFIEKQQKKFRQVEWNNLNLNVNIEYAISTIEKKEDAFLTLKPLLAQFENVCVIRVLCKEEMIGKLGLNEDLSNLSKTHEESWQTFIRTMRNLENISFHECEPNNPEYYLAHDSHLSKKGNLFLSKFVDNIL